MANRTVRKNELAQEKKDLAGRARRLAQTLSQDADRVLLTHYADELATRSGSASAANACGLTSAVCRVKAIRLSSQQVQQQHCGRTSNTSKVPKEKCSFARRLRKSRRRYVPARRVRCARFHRGKGLSRRLRAWCPVTRLRHRPSARGLIDIVPWRPAPFSLRLAGLRTTSRSSDGGQP